MKLLDRFKAAIAPAPTAWDQVVREVKSAPIEYGVPFDLTNQKLVSYINGNTSSTGFIVSETAALNVSTFWSCVRVLAETLGALPWGVYEGENRVREHSLDVLLNGEPNQYQTGQNLRESLMVNLTMRGDGYALIDRRPSGEVIQVLPLPWEKCKPRLMPRTNRLVYDATVFNETRTELPRDQIWQTKGFGGDLLHGMSALRYGCNTIGLARAAEEYAATFFRSGAAPAGVVEMKEWMTDEQHAKTRERLQQFWQNVHNSHQVQILEGDMKFHALSPPPEDVQLLLTRTFQMQDICRLLRVPPHLVGDLARSTNNNIEQQSLEFVMYCMLPYVKRFETSGSLRLFKPSEVGRLQLRLNVDGLLRADSAGRSALYTVMIDKGVMHRNEVRALENLPRSSEPNMDAFTVQSQMVPIDKLGQIPPAATPSTPATPPAASA